MVQRSVLRPPAIRKGPHVPKIKILLADDNHAVLNYVSKLLRKGSYIVGTVDNGGDVLREYDRLKPDVIVLDISIGGPSGIDVACRLRDFGCHSKIIFLTVHEDSEFVNAAMGSGGSAYVVKSQLSNDLSSAIDAVLAGKLFVSQCLLYKHH